MGQLTISHTSIRPALKQRMDCLEHEVVRKIWIGSCIEVPTTGKMFIVEDRWLPFNMTRMKWHLGGDDRDIDKKNDRDRTPRGRSQHRGIPHRRGTGRCSSTVHLHFIILNCQCHLFVITPWHLCYSAAPEPPGNLFAEISLVIIWSSESTLLGIPGKKGELFFFDFCLFNFLS